ncbi:MAG: GatB/YqeY domain-containing protein [Ardenticatenaceae bacterium]|nr:GatB/YqeY domain-containing protein [Ardenticatenaceae bacterium]MCB9443085.1 GatB/YqeY domain-containing protein [Ardenticatenaceae bacterium]
MNLKEQLRADMATAMRDGDNDKRNTLRMLLAAVKQTEVDDQVTLDDAGVQAVLTKQAKQRRESIDDYEKAGRTEMAANEKMELAIIESYLPQMMSKEDVKAIAAQVIAELGINDMKDMGQIMGRLMPQLKGQADGRIVNEAVRELLQNR